MGSVDEVELSEAREPLQGGLAAVYSVPATLRTGAEEHREDVTDEGAGRLIPEMDGRALGGCHMPPPTHLPRRTLMRCPCHRCTGSVLTAGTIASPEPSRRPSPHRHHSRRAQAESARHARGVRARPPTSLDTWPRLPARPLSWRRSARRDTSRRRSRAAVQRSRWADRLRRGPSVRYARPLSGDHTLRPWEHA